MTIVPEWRAYVGVASIGLAATLSTAGCGGASKAPATPADSPSGRVFGGEDVYGPIPAASLGSMETQTKACERAVDDADKALADGLATARRASPRPGMHVDPPGVLLGKLAKDRVDFVVELDTDAQSIRVHDSLTDAVTRWKVPPKNAREKKEYARLQKDYARDGWMLQVLTSQVVAIGGALSTANSAARSCSDTVRSSASIFAVVRTASSTDPAKVLTKRLLRATRRADAIVGATTGLLASYQAASAGGQRDLVDRAFEAAEHSLPLQVDVTDADVENEVALVVATYGHPETPAEPPTSPSPSDGSGQAIKSLPETSPQRRAFEGTQALKSGDYRTALKLAASVVPETTPIGKALASAAGVFEKTSAADAR